MKPLDELHHIAVSVTDLKATLAWYRNTFAVETLYEDDTWALLKFNNISVALVIPGQHPPHICVARPDAQAFGELKTHRDGTRSVYVNDPSGNFVEVLEA